MKVKTDTSLKRKTYIWILLLHVLYILNIHTVHSGSVYSRGVKPPKKNKQTNKKQHVDVILFLVSESLE